MDAINAISMIFVIILATYVSVVDLYYFLTVREPFRWIKLIYAIVGGYWVIIYTYFVFNIHVYYQDTSRILTRIGIISLLLSLSYGATVRLYMAKPGRTPGRTPNGH